MNALHGRHVVQAPTILSGAGCRPRPGHARCMQPNALRRYTGKSGRRSERRPNLRIVQAALANQDVKTSDHFKFTNSISTNSFEVKGDINKVFRYAADFSHMDRWDPGEYRWQ